MGSDHCVCNCLLMILWGNPIIISDIKKEYSVKNALIGLVWWGHTRLAELMYEPPLQPLSSALIATLKSNIS